MHQRERPPEKQHDREAPAEQWQQARVSALRTFELISSDLNVHTVGEYKDCIRTVGKDAARIMDSIPIGTRLTFASDANVYVITRYILSKTGFIHQVHLQSEAGVHVKKIWTSLLDATMVDRPPQSTRLQDLIGVIRTKITPHVYAAYERMKVEDLAEEIRVRSVHVFRHCMDLSCPDDATLEKMVAEEMEEMYGTRDNA